MTAESVRNGSHSIIEATASLTRASVISSDQSIALSMLLPRRGEEKAFPDFGPECPRGGLVLAVFPSWFT
jgi:hypothetical protein